jgi:undecaprenyl-diphosphatase
MREPLFHPPNRDSFHGREPGAAGFAFAAFWRNFAWPIAPLSPRLRAALVLLALLAVGFALDPLVHGLARDLPGEVKAAFRAITDLGRSGWIFSLCAPGLVYFACLLRYGHWRARQAALFGDAAASFGYVFEAVASAGITVGAIKLLAGRARPRFFDTLGPMAFEPLSASHGFNSFPSGHAATAFALAVALGLLFPRLRKAALALAALIALSRVATGAHYLSDVLAGGIIGAWFALRWREWFSARGLLWRPIGGGGFRRRRLFPAWPLWAWEKPRIRFL